MLTVYGMSRHAPNLSLVDRNQNSFLGQGSVRQPRSEKLEELIDSEMQEILAACYEGAKSILQRERGKLQQMAQTLLQKEKIDEQEILAILGPRERQEALKCKRLDHSAVKVSENMPA
jgi:cell division protease FtsH